MNNTKPCHVHKFSDDTAIVKFIRRVDEGEYKSLVKDFTSWSHLNHLQLNTSKTIEVVLDFRRLRPCPLTVNINGEEIHLSISVKYSF